MIPEGARGRFNRGRHGKHGKGMGLGGEGWMHHGSVFFAIRRDTWQSRPTDDGMGRESSDSQDFRFLF